MLPRSALPSICCRVSPASLVLTHFEATISRGNSARQSSVTRQLSASIVIPTTSTATALDTVVDRVLVKARWAPMTSLLRRLTRAPVWVRVKNAIDWRWTCPKTRVRRSKIRPSPIRAESQASRMLITALKIARPAIASASHATRPRLSARMPSSTMRWTSSGAATTRLASSTVSARNTEIVRRWGTAKPSTRRTVARPTRLSSALRSERRCRQAAPAFIIPDTCPPAPAVVSRAGGSRDARLSPGRGRGSAVPGPRARGDAAPPAAWRPPRASVPWSRGPRPARPR